MTKERRVQAKRCNRRIDNDYLFQENIIKYLKNGFSPEQIHGYLHRVQHPDIVGKATIYRWLHRHWAARKHLLRYKGKPRVPYGSRKNSWQPKKRHISERPAIVKKRRRVGDWEVDLVHGIREDSMHCLLTIVERATGYGFIFKLVTGVAAGPVTEAIIRYMKQVPCYTITADNGIEFAQHKTIERALGCNVYFADPSSPQQRGTNENYNGLVREYFPKGMSLEHVTQQDADDVAYRLNMRPRKRFGYLSPATLFSRATKRRYRFR
jgi:IS30 family transposase